MFSGYIPKNIQKATAVIGVSTMLFMVTSCSAETDEVTVVPASPTASAAPSASPSSTTEVPSALKVGEQGTKPGDVINGIPTLPELANDGKGDYIQTTISDDDPEMQFNSALLTADSEIGLFTDEELAEAQKFIVRFVAEETIDSVINNNSADHANVDRWIAKNKHKFDPNYSQGMFDALYDEANNIHVVHRAGWRPADSQLVYGADKTRVTERTIKVNQVTTKQVEGLKAVGFDITAHYGMSRLRNDRVTPEYTDAAINYTLTKNSSGEWVIAGVLNTFTTDT